MQAHAPSPYHRIQGTHLGRQLWDAMWIGGTCTPSPSLLGTSTTVLHRSRAVITTLHTHSLASREITQTPRIVSTAHLLSTEVPTWARVSLGMRGKLRLKCQGQDKNQGKSNQWSSGPSRFGAGTPPSPFQLHLRSPFCLVRAPYLHPPSIASRTSLPQVLCVG